MDSLRPDRDDLDLYNSRKNKNKSAKASAGKRDDIGNKKQQVGKAGSGSSSTVNAVRSSEVRAPVAASQSSASPLVVSLLLLMLLALGGLSYLYWQQSQTVVGLEERLSSADEFIGQSKLLLARLEGEVSETGAELMQTGTSAEKKMAFLESEVRKLWGVSYDRNRKTIQGHEKKIEALTKKLAESQKSLATHEVSLSALKADSDKGMSVLDGRIASLSGELSITRAEREEFLTQFNEKLSTFDSSTQEFEKRIAALQARMSDSAKVQLENQESL
ncbi:hypothetical protein, partial [Oleiphilus sp. HI0123]